MRTHTARFLAGVADPRHLPRPGYPEVAVAGRSNVGKSSLLNRLVGQRGLARVSKTPGRTQQINFFLIDDRLTLVDLPGYGFARVPVRVQERWKQLVETYVTGRRSLRAVVVLVDLRRGIEPDDGQLLAYLEAHGVPAIVAGTKADKLRRGERLRATRELVAGVPAGAVCVVCSSTTGEGIDQLWAAIERHVRAQR